MRIVVSALAAAVFLIFPPAWAESDGVAAMLNKVSLRLTAEQWVPSKTALATIGINASVSNAGLEKIQETVLAKLQLLSSRGEWHIISFDRSLDQSGLENIQMRAQARLPSAALVNLREKSKKMSRPGETYTLENIQFTPSEAELRDANIELRGDIYQQAKNELERINKLSADQKYYMHEINFLNSIIPAPLSQNTMMSLAFKNTTGANANSMTVGDKIYLAATVVFASLPEQAVTKILR